MKNQNKPAPFSLALNSRIINWMCQFVFLISNAFLMLSFHSPDLDSIKRGNGTDFPDVFLATFTAPADVCVDAPASLHSFLGSPTGGVYSGPGVQNIGDGLNFVFRASEAGVGTHTLTYTVTGETPVSDNITVFALPNVTFTALPDLAIDAGVQNGLSGGSPTGGVYSGPGVTDNGNGTTYSFNPATAGGGEKTLTYSVTNGNGCSDSASDQVIVTTAINVTFEAPADLCLNAGVQTGLGGATPTGGTYSGAGVSDDGNGMTYSFDPASAGVGMHSLTYDVTVGGDMGSGSDVIEVFALPAVSFTAPANVCMDVATELHILLGTPSPGIYSGPGVNDLGREMHLHLILLMLVLVCIPCLMPL